MIGGIFIIKQNNQTSELTYDIVISFLSGSAIICNIYSCDILFHNEQKESFLPMMQKIPVNFLIIPDDVPEGIETFTAQLRSNDAATIDPREATISIFDNGEYHL